MYSKSLVLSTEQIPSKSRYGLHRVPLTFRVLTPSTSEYDFIGNRIFKEVIKVK